MLDAADQKALEAAYLDFSAQLLAWLVQRVGDEQIARDLLHDVFHKAITTAVSKTLPANPFAWLKTVARTTLIDYYRRTRPSEPLAEDMPISTDGRESPAEQLSQCLRPLVDELPEKYRDVLLATTLGDMTLSRYALDQGVTLSAIKSRAARGRDQLRKELLKCCHIELGRAGVVEAFKPLSNSQCCDGQSVKP